MKRLLEAEVSGFRAFANEQLFDLDADVVILAGPNGSGKTSFFDSILWGLSGRLPRFAGRKTEAISLYAPAGQARVALTFLDDDGSEFIVTRSASSEERSEVLVDAPDGRLEGPAAEVRILQSFWPAALQTQDAVAAFCMAFTRSVYLQQDLVREFIESDSEEARFTVLSELVGAGRLTEFLRDLENQRNAWSRTRTERERDVSDAAARVTQVRTRLDRLRDAPAGESIQANWEEWWTAVRGLGVTAEPPALEAIDASQAVSEALAVLQAERRALERRHLAARQLLEEWSSQLERPMPESSSIDALRTQGSEVSNELERLRAELESAQALAARERERLTQLQEAEAELRSLATLALRHLGETCPVCEQTYDIKTTRKRLEALVETPRGDQHAPDLGRIGELGGQIAEKEQLLAELSKQLEHAERALSADQAWKEMLKRRLGELDLPEDANRTQLEELVTTMTARGQMADDLYSRGEGLALGLARASEAAQRTELEQQLAAAEELLAERQRVLTLHEQAGDAATTMLEAGRGAASEAVDARVRQIEPLVERIYARMDPHPAFTQIRLATSYPRGRGHVRTVVADPSAGLKDRDPYTLFSSSQLNALAVSLFLGLNLGTQGAPLRVAMLDDPLQSLDDVNLLGLIDTLRRTKALRQLFLSTHDRRLASLVQRKLRPVGDDRSTRVYSFADWTPEGLTIEESDVVAEPEEFRIVTAA
jgi:DNA repair exonuclease SbcCD ATPase subunit